MDIKPTKAEYNEAKARIERITDIQQPLMPLQSILEQLMDIRAGINECRVTLDDHADRVRGCIAEAEEMHPATDSRDLPVLHQIYHALETLKASVGMLHDATVRNTGLA